MKTENAQNPAQVASNPAGDTKIQPAPDRAPEVQPDGQPPVLDDDPLAGDEIPPPARQKRGSGGRTKRFEVVMSEAEIRKRDALAEAAACTGAQLVRSLIMSTPIPDRGLLQVLAEMRRQGGLLKHVAGQMIDAGHDPAAVTELLTLARNINEISVKVGALYAACD